MTRKRKNEDNKLKTYTILTISNAQISSMEIHGCSTITSSACCTNGGNTCEHVFCQ